tara:strand:+ start:786 stop:1118 length:333 start_codon:yes stop_codon:yes gene_type:complete
MKIRPVILCGGSGTRLWPNQKKHIPKQFIDFGNWNLFEKAIVRTKGSIFDYPIISTNSKYLKLIKKFLRKHKVNKYKIVRTFKKKYRTCNFIYGIDKGYSIISTYNDFHS